MHAPAALESTTCPFCDARRLEAVLARGEHFYLLADHAPLCAGHLLLVSRAHVSCFGALPAALDDELAALKQRVRAFQRRAYAAPTFFEHGIFHQTVYHAHLHALPFGPLALALPSAIARAGHATWGPADVRAWHRAHGSYFSIELPAMARPTGAVPDSSSDAALSGATIFPADEAVYAAVMGTLRRATAERGWWEPQAARRLTRQATVRALLAAWQACADERRIERD